MLLNPSVRGYQKPKSKRDSNWAFFRAKVLPKNARILVRLDPNAMLFHDAPEIRVTQRFVGNCEAAGCDGVHRVWIFVINYTLNERKCQIF